MVKPFVSGFSYWLAIGKFNNQWSRFRLNGRNSPLNQLFCPLKVHLSTPRQRMVAA